ncbi:TlpA family protein disulfide reductase [Pseudodonghicola flavimaris]|uniref:TlpA disulfide reductase family protein n=1 Tax=Pseudodonghicola flavimaris TaxID=3050036 RepID=A0ABT7EX91_9RHOB|nr:TlpA disulfide reductase family protein [Pseudodonghicola flavimaris]MDK3016958.1 TlpA disulfide reductase family protein [Pseudodonghicola flavimaris]
MRLFRFLTLYMALMLGANVAAAADLATLQALREGDMKKLALHETPKPVSDLAFQKPDGAGTATLAEYRGKYLLVNFWATWCAPCRKEMPMLNALQEEFGGEGFQVVTIATGRNSPAGIKKFFDEIGVTDLPRYQDPKQALARDMGVLGLPVTLIVDPEGREIGRLMGDADWTSESAKAIIAALLLEEA